MASIGIRRRLNARDVLVPAGRVPTTMTALSHRRRQRTQKAWQIGVHIAMLNALH
jgi:hypothetical protein